MPNDNVHNSGWHQTLTLQNYTVMANYYFCKYAITGDKTELDELEAMLKRLAARKNDDEVGWGPTWLGYIYSEFGEDPEQCSCKGDWGELKRLDDNTLMVEMELAWVPADEVIDLFRDKWPSLDYIFLHEQPESEVYETNDDEGKYFPMRYRFWGYLPTGEEDENGDEEYFEFDEYFNTEADVIAYANDTLHHPVESLEDIEQWETELNEDDEGDSYIGLREVEVVDRLCFDGVEPVVS